MRIFRLEPGLRRSPDPQARLGATHLCQRRCKTKLRVLFTATGDSFLALHQLVSCNALLFPYNENLSLF